VDFSRHDPAIDPEAFPDTPSEWFWTASPYANFGNYALVVDFYNGYADDNDVSDYNRVRCVR
jgi:hypothetical protein